MPKSTPHKLAYQKEYNARPEIMHRRVMQTKARRQAVREGRAHPGDGMAVDHIHALDDGGGGGRKNLRVVKESVNKGWRKGTSTYSPARGKFNR